MDTSFPLDSYDPYNPLTASPEKRDAFLNTPYTLFELLQRLSLAVNSSILQDDVYDAIGNVMKDYFAFDALSIAILAPNLQGIGSVVHIGSEGFSDVYSENHRYTGTDPLLETFLKGTNKAFTIPPYECPASILMPPHPCHAVAMPIYSKRQPIGVLTMSRHPRFEAYSHSEVQMLEETAPILAIALEHARLASDMKTLLGRQLLMNELSVKIRQSLETATILETATSSVGQVLGVSRCMVHAFEHPIPLEKTPAELDLIPEMTEHKYSLVGSPQYDSIPFFQHSYGFEWDLFTKKLVQDAHKPLLSQLDAYYYFQDATTSAQRWEAFKTFYEANHLHSIAIVPIITKDSWVGSISLHQCNKVRVWLNEDKQLLDSIVEHLGFAITQARLFEEIHHQKDKLADALEELQQAQMYLIQSEKMAMLGQFVAGIAHEVNTPLGTMISNTQTLEKILAKLTPEAPPDAKFLSMAHEVLKLNTLAGERIRDTVNNLRNFARLDESDFKEVDIHEGLESTLLLTKNALARKIEIRKVFDSSLPKLNCFAGLLNQVFMNLIVNAGHALEEAENPVITIQTAHVQDAQLGNVLCVSVEDNGKGIAPEHMTRIFDPGFTTKSRGVGTGLGLALCFRIVEKHKGRIECTSEVGKGTRFNVLIPF